ncbi:MAG: Uma2 family endonuclease [Polyangiales bacterium]
MTAARTLSNDPRVEAARAAADPALRAEIVDGVLLMAPAPLSRHQAAQGALFALLRRALRFDNDRTSPPSGWVFIQVPELHLGVGPDKCNPDLCGWRASRAPSLDDSPIAIVPDWICEVLSPSTESFDRGSKMPAFARHGVESAWLVDPELRQLEVYRLDRGSLREVARYQGNDRVCAPPFESESFDLSELWGW